MDKALQVLARCLAEKSDDAAALAAFVDLLKESSPEAAVKALETLLREQQRSIMKTMKELGANLDRLRQMEIDGLREELERLLRQRQSLQRWRNPVPQQTPHRWIDSGTGTFALGSTLRADGTPAPREVEERA